jgi:hypothetical protein
MAFFNHAISPQHAKLATLKHELIGLVKAMWHWCPYLWMLSFIMRTDHFSLKYLLDQHLSTIPQHVSVSKLFGYRFVVEFKPDRQNHATDAMSRRHEEDTAVHALFIPNFALLD